VVKQHMLEIAALLLVDRARHAHRLAAGPHRGWAGTI
jgi:hypothetical protein